MQAGTFEIASWDEPRLPLPDEAMDAERRGRYWAWNNGAGPSLPDGGTIPRVRLSEGRTWVRIGTHAQADYEAFHMQHSVGYNFDHYARLGDIFSLRDAANTPVMTMVVAGDRVVHARGRMNEPLTDEAWRSLSAFASACRWDVADRGEL